MQPLQIGVIGASLMVMYAVNPVSAAGIGMTVAGAALGGVVYGAGFGTVVAYQKRVGSYGCGAPVAAFFMLCGWLGAVVVGAMTGAAFTPSGGKIFTDALATMVTSRITGALALLGYGTGVFLAAQM